MDASDSKYTISLKDSELSFANTWEDIEAIDDSALDSVRKHDDIDHPFAIRVPDNLEAGEYTMLIKVVEDGDPWENTRTVKLDFTIKEIEVED